MSGNVRMARGGTLAQYTERLLTEIKEPLSQARRRMKWPLLPVTGHPAKAGNPAPWLLVVTHLLDHGAHALCPLATGHVIRMP